MPIFPRTRSHIVGSARAIARAINTQVAKRSSANTLLCAMNSRALPVRSASLLAYRWFRPSHTKHTKTTTMGARENESSLMTTRGTQGSTTGDNHQKSSQPMTPTMAKSTFRDTYEDHLAHERIANPMTHEAQGSFIRAPWASSSSLGWVRRTRFVFGS